MDFGGGRVMTVAILVEGHEIALSNIRLTSPRSPTRIAENRALTLQLTSSLRHEKRPAIVIGDCNFPVNSQQMDAFREIGFQPADDLTGLSLPRTWSPIPDGPPILRIDHAILSRHFSVQKNEVGPAIGSDHRPILVDVSLHPAP